jgi:hypothetical protein
VLSGNGTLKYRLGFYAYSSSERGGINVSAGDVNGDGLAEIITGSPAGKIGEVKVFTRTGTLLKKINAYGNSYTLGVKPSSGDVNADGIDEIIVGPEVGGRPRVKVLKMSGQVLGDFVAYSSTLKNGVETATANFVK